MARRGLHRHCSTSVFNNFPHRRPSIHSERICIFKKSNCILYKHFWSWVWVQSFCLFIPVMWKKICPQTAIDSSTFYFKLTPKIHWSSSIDYRKFTNANRVYNCFITEVVDSRFQRMIISTYKQSCIIMTICSEKFQNCHELAIIRSECIITDYRYDPRTGPLSCFATTNSWFGTRNRQK
jgi:hypothetical protein